MRTASWLFPRFSPVGIQDELYTGTYRCDFQVKPTFYVTTQLYVADDFLRSYQDFGVYRGNDGSITLNDNDFLFRQMEAGIASAMTLSFDGSNENGYTATFHLGIDATDAGVSTSDGSSTNGSTTDGGDQETSSEAPTSSGQSGTLVVLCTLSVMAALLVLVL
jgi:hypothetical protein